MQGNELRSQMSETRELDHLVFSKVGKRLYTTGKTRPTPSTRALVLYTWLKDNSNPYLPRITYLFIKIPNLLRILGMSRSTFYRARQELEALGVLCTKRRPWGLTYLIRHVDLREITAYNFLERSHYIVGKMVEHHSVDNNIYYTRQYICQLHEVKTTCTRKYKIYRTSTEVYRIRKYTCNMNKKFYRRLNIMSKKADQLDLQIPRLADEVPKMLGKPLLVSVVASEEHHFPYVAKGLNVSAFWYWAINRYKKLGIDFAVTSSYIKQGSMRFAKNILPLLTTWEEIQKYIDWYLSRTDEFVQNTCGHNFNFLISTTCYNQYQKAKDKMQQVIITDAERKNNKTISITNLEELNARVEKEIKRRGLKNLLTGTKYEHF